MLDNRLKSITYQTISKKLYLGFFNNLCLNLVFDDEFIYEDNP